MPASPKKKDQEPQANLGLASSRELLLELQARFLLGPNQTPGLSVTLTAWLEDLPAEVLNYRTVDADG